MDETDTRRRFGSERPEGPRRIRLQTGTHRTLGFFSSFAAAFSYISPSTGIFTLFALDSRPSVRLHLELADRRRGPDVGGPQLRRGLEPLPVAGSVFQWTKYLAGRPYAWFTGWIYLFAGVLTVTAVVVTLPLTILRC